MAIKLLILMLCGGLGTVARYGLSGAVQRYAGSGFPWGTFAVNVVGCFLFGLLWMIATDRNIMSAETRFFVLTGFMGGFTTFSTYMFESRQLLEQGQPLLCFANIAGQILLGMAALFAGVAAARLI